MQKIFIPVLTVILGYTKMKIAFETKSRPEIKGDGRIGRFKGEGSRRVVAQETCCNRVVM